MFAETFAIASGYATRYLSLADYAGDTVRIAFRHHSTDDQEQLQLTNVTVGQATAPVVTLDLPASAIVGDAVVPHLSLFSALPVTDITWTIWTDTMGNTQTISSLAPSHIPGPTAPPRAITW